MLKLLVLVEAFCFAFGFYEERLDGEYILGAVLPIHNPGLNRTQCGVLNMEGVATAEAFRLAVQKINQLTFSGSGSRVFGYDLRDSCGTLQGVMDVGYAFNMRMRNHRKRKTGQKPVSVVIGKFDEVEYPAVQLLSLEKLPQISYVKDNIKLKPIGQGKAATQSHLISAYPGDTLKVRAAIETMRKLKVEYFTLVVSKDQRGINGVELIKKAFTGNIQFCHSEVLFVDTKDGIVETVSKIKKNALAKVVLLHLDHQKSLWVFDEAKKQNLSDITWFSTLSWSAKTNELKPMATEVEGMISVTNKPQSPSEYERHLNELTLPYTREPFLRSVFLNKTGAKECLTLNSSKPSAVKDNCNELHKQFVDELFKYSEETAYLIDAVFIFKEAINKMKTEKRGSTLIETIKSLEFLSPMTRNPIKFDENGVMLDIISIVYNLQANLAARATKLELIRAGEYDFNRLYSKRLNLNTGVLRWKNGTKEVPISKCSPDCTTGWRRVLPIYGPSCCWTCKMCPNGSISQSNNSASCTQCSTMQVANPSQTSCVKFRQTSFRWFNPMGEFMIFLITAGLCATFFTLGIFSQNRDCDVVKSADYKVMVFMLFGLMLCFFTPVPLLLEPSATTCISYVIMFNIGLSIPLAVLFIKSAAVRHRFFDENMELVNGSLGSMPHLVIASAVIVIQAIILAVGINLTSTNIVYFNTDQWDLKYAECAYVKNAVFWVAFGYNVIVSILMNVASCKSTKMEGDFNDQKWVCISTCCFYLVAYLFVVCVYAVYGSNVVEAASVLIIVFGLMFILTYFAPKLRLILSRQAPKPEYGPDGKPLMKEEEEQRHTPVFTSHMSGAEGLRKHKILGMKIKGDSIEGQSSKA